MNLEKSLPLLAFLVGVYFISLCEITRVFKVIPISLLSRIDEQSLMSMECKR